MHSVTLPTNSLEFALLQDRIKIMAALAKYDPCAVMTPEQAVGLATASALRSLRG
jgi:hypothetical protein